MRVLAEDFIRAPPLSWHGGERGSPVAHLTLAQCGLRPAPAGFATRKERPMSTVDTRAAACAAVLTDPPPQSGTKVRPRPTGPVASCRVPARSPPGRRRAGWRRQSHPAGDATAELVGETLYTLA